MQRRALDTLITAQTAAAVGHHKLMAQLAGPLVVEGLVGQEKEVRLMHLRTKTPLGMRGNPCRHLHRRAGKRWELSKENHNRQAHRVQQRLGGQAEVKRVKQRRRLILHELDGLMPKERLLETEPVDGPPLRPQLGPRGTLHALPAGVAPIDLVNEPAEAAVRGEQRVPARAEQVKRRRSEESTKPQDRGTVRVEEKERETHIAER